MKNVTILVLETSVPAAIVDPRYMFSAVNEFYKSAGHQPFFNITLAGLTKEVTTLQERQHMEKNMKSCEEKLK